MKRSEVNRLMSEAKAFFEGHAFRLPPWGYWSPADWQAVGPEAAEIAQCGLGWDITDFGSGSFSEHGLLLFTIRNGTIDRPGKAYAEKIMIVRDRQLTPYHFHFQKTEDIINRGGGLLVLELANAAADGGLADSPVEVSIDGIRRRVAAGGRVALEHGESITLPPGLYHAFWGEGGHVLVGEVSSVNDDRTDNRFLEPQGRFPEIEEDEAPLHLLCTEYPAGLAG